MSVSPNARRWLNAISFAEGTLQDGTPQYNMIFGGGKFSDLSKHPDTVISSGKYNSAAAGAYQFMPKTYARVQQQLRLPDFGPASQDQAALELIRQRGVDPDRDPITRENIAKLSGEWASLPTMSGQSYYGQPVRKVDELVKFNDPNFSYNAYLPETQTTEQPGPKTSGDSSDDAEMVALGFLLGEIKALKEKEPPQLDNDDLLALVKSQIEAGADDGQDQIIEAMNAMERRRRADEDARRVQQFQADLLKKFDPLSQLFALTPVVEDAKSRFQPGQSVI